MITIVDLLDDKVFKEYFCKPPTLPAHMTSPQMATTPWRLFVQFHGDSKWRKKDCATYADAFNLLKRLRAQGKVRDAAINCRRRGFAPPTRIARIKGKYVTDSQGQRVQATKIVYWSVKLPADEVNAHRWCPYCRRPTVFKFFTRHHALQGLNLDIPSDVRRCMICGAGEAIANYYPEEQLRPSTRKSIKGR